MPRPCGRPRPSKYQLLADYLFAQEADSVMLPLAQIEAIVGFSLSDAAYVAHSYWAYSPTALVRILTEAGWEARLHQRAHAVVFTRTVAIRSA